MTATGRPPLLVRRSGKSAASHLPPGREPGAQTLRNRVGFPFWEYLAGLVGSGMLVSGLFVAAGGRGPRFDRKEELFGGLFFALMGFMCAAWAYSMRRHRRPLSLARRARGTTLAVDRDEASRGESLVVTVTVGGSEPLEVGLVCTERYDRLVRAQHGGGSSVVRQTTEATAHQEWRTVECGARDWTASFAIPPDAPYSYEGSCVSYAWSVSARMVRRLRSDPRLDRPIWVPP